MPSRQLNRILWAVVVVLIAVFAMQAMDKLDDFLLRVGTLDVRAAPVEDTVFLHWRGQIEAPMESKIADAFESHKNDGHTFVLALSSPGGSIDHGARVARLLRRMGETHRIETVVEAGKRCASMCVPVYLQGTRRTAAADAQFMFHEVSYRESLSDDEVAVPERAKVSATDHLFEKYFTPAGVPETWIAKVRAEMAGGHDIWKTARELVNENAGIVQDVRD